MRAAGRARVWRWRRLALAAVVMLAIASLRDRVAAAEPGERLAAAGLSGSIGLQYFSSNHRLDDEDHFPGANLVLKQRLSIAEGVRWVAEARVLAQEIGHDGDDGAPHGSVRALRYADEVTTELREGYFEVVREHWEIRAGKQIIVWGRADEINPTDVITPKNFLLLMPEGQPGYRFGTTALKLDAFLPWAVRATGVWVPVFTPSVIPLDVPPGVEIEERLPAIRLDEGSAGVKLDRSGGAVDGSLSYFYGFNPLPEIRVEEAHQDATTGNLAGRVALTHARQHMIGADAATARGRFGYRAEVAYVDTSNEHGRRVDAVVPYLFYVVGVERSFLENLSVIVQYVGRFVPDRVDPERALADPDPVRGRARFLAARETFVINQQLDTVQNGWSLRVDKKFWNDTLDCELLGLHYIERNDYYLRPKISYELADGWRGTVGGEVFGGPQRSFFGRVRKNTGAFVELAYSF